MSDCQFPDQCGFPNCFCVGEYKFDVKNVIEGAERLTVNSDGVVILNPNNPRHREIYDDSRLTKDEYKC